MICQNANQYAKTSVLIVGAGPAGLAAAIALKNQKPDLDICVVDKAASPGNHNLSGAVMEIQCLGELLAQAQPSWQETDEAKNILARKITKDQVLLFLGKKISLSMMPPIKLAKLLRLGFGQMVHQGDYIVSISKLTNWLEKIAKNLGVEVLYGLAAEDIVLTPDNQKATGIKLIEQGLDQQQKSQPNYTPAEIVNADFILLAEGCDGLVTEQFVSKANLQRQANPLFSVGVKELIEVSPEQYENFGDTRVVHAMGFPLWTPFIGPGLFGGGIMYAFGNNQIAVGMIAGTDWKYRDFNVQDALVRFKQHRFVQQFIEGGTVVEAGAKMIPEGGFYAIPRDPTTNAIGKQNVLILGDSAGFVNMLKIKGLHNGIYSGIAAAQAVAEALDQPDQAAELYTMRLEETPVIKEMRSARKFRQTVAKLGNTAGMPLSTLSGLLPRFNIEKDYQAMTQAQYRHKCQTPFDKDSFIAMANVEHREEQPSHCHVLDTDICENLCRDRYGMPCITFCPAGVYEEIQGRLKPANPSNCLHCKTCQNKCPFDNLRWHVPEGSGGPQYANM